MTADAFTDEHGHQRRERPVPCRACGSWTWAYDRVCAACVAERFAAHEDEIGDLLMLRALEERDR